MISKFYEEETFLKVLLSLSTFLLLLFSLLNFYIYDEFIKGIVYFQFFILSAFILKKLKNSITKRKAIEMIVIIAFLFLGFLYIEELRDYIFNFLLF